MIQKKKIEDKEDRLIIGYDYSNGQDHTALLIGRRLGRGYKVLNIIYDKEAEEIYNKLIGGTKD